MASTFNLSATALAYIADGSGLGSLMANAVLTIYDGRQPVSADTALNGNNSCAAFTFPPRPLGIVGKRQIVVLDPMGDTVWSRSTTPTFARVVQGTTTIFDCSVGQTADDPDIVIKQNPVRIGDVAHIEHGAVKSLFQRRPIGVSA